MGMIYPAAAILTDTNAHTGRFGKIHALEDSVMTVVSTNVTKNGSTTLASVAIKHGSEVEGIFTSITLASGSVVAYLV